MTRFLFSLPLTWTFVRGGGASCGTELRKADGTMYATATGFRADVECNRFGRRDAARHERREARLHIAEQLDALNSEVYQRKGARDAEEWREDRMWQDRYEIDDLERAKRTVAERHPYLSGAQLKAAINLVAEGACHICLGHSC